MGCKAYGSIGHIQGSRVGPSDMTIHEGQARICTTKKRDIKDEIILQEKLDGSCCAVARIEGELVALGRSGYLASTSPHEMHHAFAAWVDKNKMLFDFLEDDERVVGEWLHQAHGTMYVLRHGPFVVFDIMRFVAKGNQKQKRVTVQELVERVGDRLPRPSILSMGPPVSIEDANAMLGELGRHGAVERAEGFVYRVERMGNVDFLAKYVRPEKVDGKYLFGEPVYNDYPGFAHHQEK